LQRDTRVLLAQVPLKKVNFLLRHLKSNLRAEPNVPAQPSPARRIIPSSHGLLPGPERREGGMSPYSRNTKFLENHQMKSSGFHSQAVSREHRSHAGCWPQPRQLPTTPAWWEKNTGQLGLEGTSEGHLLPPRAELGRLAAGRMHAQMPPGRQEEPPKAPFLPFGASLHSRTSRGSP